MVLRHVVPALLVLLPSLPVQAIPEIGVDDRRLTVTGAPGSNDYLTANTFPSVAHNPDNDEYLVVWRQVDVEREYLQVMAQRLDADGQPVGQPVAVSQHGANSYFFGSFPAVTYDPAHGDYLVFWDGFTGPDFPSRRIFVRRVTPTGTPIGDSVPLSDVGTPGSYPVVAFDPATERHAVAWIAHETLLGEDGEHDETEIYVQLFKRDAEGAIVETGPDVRLSSIGGYPNDGSLFWASAHDLDVAYSSARGQFLVVWSGSELVLRGQWFDAEGEEHGEDFTLTNDWGYPVKLAGEDSSGNLLLAWSEHFTDDFAYANEYAKIVGGFIDPATGLLGQKHTFAELADAEHPDFGARLSDVIWNPLAGEYLLAWTGNTVPVEERPLDETTVAILIKEDVYVTRVDVTGAPRDSTRIGTTGPEGVVDYRTSAPAVALNEEANRYQIVWFADDEAGDMVDDKYELFGQQLSFEDADISVQIETEPASGGHFVSVENTSAVVARDVRISWPQPVDLSLHFSDTALCGAHGAQTGCALGDLPPGARAMLFVLATPAGGATGDIELPITAATQTYESDTSDNTGMLTVNAEPPAPEPDSGGGTLGWLAMITVASGFCRRRSAE